VPRPESDGLLRELPKRADAIQSVWLGTAQRNRKERFMNKRIQKKLTLSKETLRNLAERDLVKVAGGFGTGGGCTGALSCDTTPRSLCYTCARTGGC
jgi:hypothetical protein